MTRAVNAGFAAHLRRAAKARRAAREGIDKVTAGLNSAQRQAVTTAYHAYLADRGRGNPYPGEKSWVFDPPAPAGPAVDWSLYDAIADYS